MPFEIHPSLILILGAVVTFLLPVNFRFLGLLAAPTALLGVLNLEMGTVLTQPFLHYELSILRVDELARVFAIIVTLILTLGVVFALHVRTKGEHVAALLYGAGSLGVVFAGDWLTLFFAWEVMAAASVFLIWYRGTRKSLGAGFRYLIIHFLGGNLLLGGVLLLMSQGLFKVDVLTGMGGLAYWLVLTGVAVNAVIVPLHAWVTDAYPEGTVTGSVFLCALTTKVAVSVLIRVFPGTDLLIWAGVLMAIYGIVFAVMENDTRRLLSYHIVSQVGFMVAGVGIGTDLALNGATAHAYSNILQKALLFMGAGAIIYSTGKRKLTDLGGLHKTMPLTAICFMVGALAISGVPLFNGFISKSITIYAAEADGHGLAAIGMYLASIGTFLSINLKMVYFMFFGQDKGLVPIKLPFNMSIAMVATASLCFIYGVYPSFLYELLPYAMAYEPFTLNKTVATLQLLLATAAAFWLVLPKIKLEPKLSLDFDWFYRRLLALPWESVLEGLRGIKGSVEVKGVSYFRKVAPFIHNPVLFAAFFCRNGRCSQDLAAVRRGSVDVPLPYDENRYRLSTNANIFLMILFIIVLFVTLYINL